MNHSKKVEHLPHFLPLAACLLFGALLWFVCPMPAGLSASGWHLLIIFITTILGVILKPLPMGALCFIAMVFAVSSHTLNLHQALSGFEDKVVWLVICALFIAKGFAVTGLGKRIGYYIISLFGHHTLGLGYCIAVSDLCIAPVIPSVAGRSVGILFPIVESIANAFESFPHSPSAQKIGSFLILTLFQTTVLSSTVFLTAAATNPLIQSLAAEHLGVELSWSTWTLGALLPGMVSFIAIPLVIYALFPPILKKTPQAVALAKEQLQQMGPLSFAEGLMLAVVLLLLVLWGGSAYFKIDSLVVAFMGLACLILGGVLSWKALLKEDHIWETFIWFSILIMMAKYLGEFGVISWIKDSIAIHVQTLSWSVALPVLALFYFYSHYFFASAAAHVLAMFVTMASLAIGLGAPPLLTVAIFAYISHLMGGLTHYGLAPAPALFGAGYTSLQSWWLCGFIISVMNIAIFAGIGSIWWHFLGWY